MLRIGLRHHKVGGAEVGGVEEEEEEEEVCIVFCKSTRDSPRTWHLLVIECQDK